SLPTCRAVPALASRQAPGRLSVRSARSHARLRVGARLRRAPGIVVGFGRLLGRTLALRNVTEIDPDAGPGGRAAAHRVDEDVVNVQARRSLRVPGLPAFEPGERVRPVRRLRDGDEHPSDAAAGGLLS